jgi:hypothetical protein
MIDGARGANREISGTAVIDDTITTSSNANWATRSALVEECVAPSMYSSCPMRTGATTRGTADEACEAVPMSGVATSSRPKTTRLPSRTRTAQIQVGDSGQALPHTSRMRCPIDAPSHRPRGSSPLSAVTGATRPARPRAASVGRNQAPRLGSGSGAMGGPGVWTRARSAAPSADRAAPV